MMSKQVGILVFDIGTTGVKSVLFHETGKIMGTSTQKMKTIYPHVGWTEQDPYGMWQGVLRGIRHLKDKGLFDTTDIVGIGLSGHMNGMIPVDAQGEPVYNEIIHSDNRSEQYCSYILDRISLDNFFAITGNRVDSHFTLPKIIWFKQHLIDSPRMATALGAAIAGGVGSGLFQNYESGAQIISLSHSIESNNEAHTQYKIQYEKFLRLYHPFRDLCYIMKYI